MRVGIVGAGAIGCAVAARLAKAGHEVALVVRDAARRVILLEQGLTCVEAEETIRGTPHAVAALSAQPLDALFLTVKAADLPAAAAAITAGAVGPETLIVPLANGVPWWLRLGSTDGGSPIAAVDPDGALLRRFSADSLVGSVVYTTAMVTGPTSVQVMRRQSLIIGAVAGASPDRIATFAETLCSAGIATETSASIRDDLWTKVALNLATNPLSVVTGAALGDLCSDPALLPTVSAILDETWRLAARLDARPPITRSEMLGRGRAAGAFRTSMLEDYRNGRPLELGAIADAVFELAAGLGIAMPVARSIADLARFRAANPVTETAQ